MSGHGGQGGGCCGMGGGSFVGGCCGSDDDMGYEGEGVGEARQGNAGHHHGTDDPEAESVMEEGRGRGCC